VTEHEQHGLPEALERVTHAAERYAQKSGLALNPDAAARRHALLGLARNLVRHGRPYCPCREVTGHPERDRANICPCRTHREEIGRSGECECGLFVAKAGPEGGKEQENGVHD
jgi:ferredoxin-thioredoxin reductase catalytic subunit